MVDELEGSLLGEGHFFVGVVAFKDVLLLNWPVNQLLLQIGRGLPGFSQVKVHFLQHIHVTLLKHLFELCLVGVLFLVVFQPLFPVLLHRCPSLRSFLGFSSLSLLEGWVHRC